VISEGTKGGVTASGRRKALFLRRSCELRKGGSGRKGQSGLPNPDFTKKEDYLPARGRRQLRTFGSEGVNGGRGKNAGIGRLCWAPQRDRKTRCSTVDGEKVCFATGDSALVIVSFSEFGFLGVKSQGGKG